MRIEGWLLDVTFTGDRAVLWVRDAKGGRVKLYDRYNPDFYAEPKGVGAERLGSLLEEHPHISEVAPERRAPSITDEKEIEVLRVKVDSVESYRRVLSQVQALPQVAETYDADLEHEIKYLCERRLVPMGEVEIEAEGGGLRSIRPVPAGLEVRPPPFTLLPFGAKLGSGGGTVVTFDEDLAEEHTFEGPTERALRDFLEYFADLDPDIVACRRTDLENLLALAASHGLQRFGSASPEGPRLWDGRAHVTLSTYRRLGLAGLVERVQYTRLPARLSSEWAAGRAIESRQCYEARGRGILLRRAGGFQPAMTLRELLHRDRGGLILAPDVGLHENVAALDFESMFPNLIVRRNISYENARGDRGREGFIVGFTRETLERRLYFKHLRREFSRGSREWLWCEGRQLALKEILFCTYGYSGCWANRFGNMDTFLEINRVARDTLMESMKVAREEGYRTIYGNNDSLFLKRPGATSDDYEGLARRIADHVGLPMAVENHFRFLVLLPQKGDPGNGAVNRYYGATVNGGLVCRGIELRRRDTPPYVARVQREAIEALLGCETVEEVRNYGVGRALAVFEEARRRLRRGEMPPDDLRVSTMLRRSPREYKARLPHVVASEALRMAGRRVEAGDLIEYIYVDADHRNPLRRVRPAAQGRGADPDKYVEVVREAARSVLMPFDADLGGKDSGHELPVRRLADFS